MYKNASCMLLVAKDTSVSALKSAIRAKKLASYETTSTN